jgi:hypothetical protein
MSDHPINVPITEVFYEYNGRTGLVESDFIAVLFFGGNISTSPTGITEIGNGYYRVSFVPDAVGTWCIDVVAVDTDAARYQGTFIVSEAVSGDIESIADAVGAIQTSINNLNDISQTEVVNGVLNAPVESHVASGTVGNYLNKIKKYTTNRVDMAAGVYQVKEDDGVTEFEHGTITPTSRRPH